MFGPLCGFLEPLQGHRVGSQIDAALLFKALRQGFNQSMVKIFAAQKGVAIGREHLEDAVSNFEDRDIKGAASEVEDRDGLVLGEIDPVGECGRRRFVDDPEDIEPRHGARFLGGLALSVIEISGDGDDRFGDRFAEKVGGRIFHLGQNGASDFLRRTMPPVGLHPSVTVFCGHNAEGGKILKRLNFNGIVLATD